MIKDILVILIAFTLFFIAGALGIIYAREVNTQYIVCPANENGEELMQSMSNGDEVLCIYSKHKPTTKQVSYKPGILKPASDTYKIKE